MNMVPANINARNMENMLASMKGQQRKVCEYIVEHYDDIGYMAITELAKQSKASCATITRLTKHLGYESFSQFKIALSKSINSFKTILHQDLDATDTFEVLVEKVFQSDMEAIGTTLKVIDCAEIRKAVLAIKNAKRFDLYGFGTSAAIVKDAGQRFLKIGRYNNVITDNDIQALSASLLDEKDVVLAISHTGRNKALFENLEIAKIAGAQIIVITHHGKSPIQELANIVLYTNCRETAFKSDAMSSRIAQMAILDAIYVALGFMNYDESCRIIMKTRKATDTKKML